VLKILNIIRINLLWFLLSEEPLKVYFGMGVKELKN